MANENQLYASQQDQYPTPPHPTPTHPPWYIQTGSKYQLNLEESITNYFLSVEKKCCNIETVHLYVVYKTHGITIYKGPNSYTHIEIPNKILLSIRHLQPIFILHPKISKKKGSSNVLLHVS